MCMQDIAIARQTRANIVIPDANGTFNNPLRIPGNPNRVALIIAARLQVFMAFILIKNPGNFNNPFWSGVIGPVAGRSFPGTDGGSLATTLAQPIWGVNAIFRIEDYGQLILSDCWLVPDTTNFVGGIWELELMAQKESEL